MLGVSVALVALTLSQPMEDSLIVLAAPEKDGYYSSVYKQIVDFHISYAKSIQQGRDSVLILTGPELYPLYEAELGSDIVVNNMQQADIWMRDFTTVNPTNPVQFKYAPAAQGGNAAQARFVQSVFNNQLLSKVSPTGNSWNLQNSNLILDGGNFVDNHVNRVIISEKILEDAGLDPLKDSDRDSVKAQIRSLFPAITEVAIIPYDDPNLGHADGMVMWVDDDTLFVNDVKDQPTIYQPLMAELKASFPTVTIVEVPSGWVAGTDFDKKFSSALGVNINSVMTKGYLYVPVFGNTAVDKEFLATLSKHTTKKVVTIEASGVARMGGSCRCLAWQTSGTFATDVRNYLTNQLGNNVNKQPVTNVNKQPGTNLVNQKPKSSSDDDDLPVFAIILIVCGCFLLLIAVAVGTYCLCFKSSKNINSDCELQHRAASDKIV
eukprot:TRINITY_DN4622_c0_g1_i3.p1 TRINITY_DN4622_c0_g1~~TRINITY_DN4622_c0_g1_i3.p1  ORF type:complete len:435 (+),score=76.96 TRINITY_DN4622_c0_g1_i3:50-1354(+)